ENDISCETTRNAALVQFARDKTQAVAATANQQACDFCGEAGRNRISCLHQDAARQTFHFGVSGTRSQVCQHGQRRFRQTPTMNQY
ncbi:MAG: hypothetical protein KJ961_04310, partial [Alphaproteobacteria bacterium]|nr:hypothetical protein [Alphaproteobacteria bacterium]